MSALITIGASALAEAGINANVSLTKQQGEQASGIKARSYPPFIHLMQPTSRDMPEGVSPGHMLLKQGGKDSKQANLGSRVKAYVIAVRGKATFYDKVEEKVMAEYSVPNAAGDGQDSTPLFEEYKAKAKIEQESGVQNKNYRAGLEVLVYLPEYSTFATYFANTPTTVQAVLETISPYGANFSENRYGTMCTLYTDKQNNKKGGWFVVQALEIEDQDVIDELSVNMPTSEEYLEALKYFAKPKASSEYSEAGIAGAEKADESAPKRTR